jgi:hypothetical protein
MEIRPPSIGVSPMTDGRDLASEMGSQVALFPRRISTIYPAPPPGADITFWGEAWEGGTFYCKADKDGRAIRASEWLYTSVARHLGFATADFCVIENGGETFFGSLQLPSAADIFEVKRFLSASRRGELGQRSEWPGQYLSQLYSYDLFIGNPDRSMRNFLMQNEGLNRRVCAIDFASARLDGFTGYHFPVETTETLRVGRFLREQHGFFRRSAYEMIDRIAAIPSGVIEGFVRGMPDDWLTKEQSEGVCENWSENRIQGRLMALRSGLADESLL